jgi:hypothetical protein
MVAGTPHRPRPSKYCADLLERIASWQEQPFQQRELANLSAGPVLAAAGHGKVADGQVADSDKLYKENVESSWR